MFTWICPQCGREVPPAYDECPDCKAKGAEGSPAATPTAPSQPPPQQPPSYYQPPAAGSQGGQPYFQQQQHPQQATPPPAYYPPPPGPHQGPQYYPPQQQHQGPPQYYQPPQQHQGPPQYYPPAPRSGFLNLPPWVMAIVFALGIGGAVFGMYSLLQSGKGSGTGPAPAAMVESPAAKPGAKTNPLQKNIEISGVRFSQDAKKRTLVTFVIINHSPADLSGLAGNVTIWGRTQKSEEDAEGTFSFSTSLAPLESKELSAPLNSKKKIYELADWQNITTDIQITAPAG